ncbi:MAG: hypothetical protein NTU97_02045 [Candidatus Magasanikbacteria bacterium]|nr:hypothetical protein [Candidatus Magasanikbacteria bacterium]
MDKLPTQVPLVDIKDTQKRIEEEFPVIHPAFSIRVAGRFFQNFEWDDERKGGEPEIKVVFNFDKAEEVNNTPFVCKISRDLKSPESFFGVAYGRREDGTLLRNWAKKFKRAELLSSREGQLIEKIV